MTPDGAATTMRESLHWRSVAWAFGPTGESEQQFLRDETLFREKYGQFHLISLFCLESLESGKEFLIPQ
jgi:hypothetical protein